MKLPGHSAIGFDLSLKCAVTKLCITTVANAGTFFKRPFLFSSETNEVLKLLCYLFLTIIPMHTASM